MSRRKCLRCSGPLTDSNTVVSAHGDAFHQQCWQASITGLVERTTARPHLPATSNKASRESDPLCPVCLRPIAAADMVTGRRDDLIHADCDYTRDQPRRNEPKLRP
jgi:hypothetical protein